MVNNTTSNSKREELLDRRKDIIIFGLVAVFVEDWTVPIKKEMRVGGPSESVLSANRFCLAQAHSSRFQKEKKTKKDRQHGQSFGNVSDP